MYLNDRLSKHCPNAYIYIQSCLQNIIIMREKNPHKAFFIQLQKYKKRGVGICVHRLALPLFACIEERMSVALYLYLPKRQENLSKKKYKKGSIGSASFTNSPRTR